MSNPPFCLHIIFWREAISQAQCWLVKEEGTKDIGHAGINRQFGHSLLQRRHQSRRASRWTLTTDGFNEIKFLSDCLSHPHSFYWLRLLWWLNFFWISQARNQDFWVCWISASEHGTQMKLMEGDIGPKWWVFIKTFLRPEFAKNIFFFLGAPLKFFLAFLVFHFLEFNRNLHRISSRDFKFHLKICIRSWVTTFWIFEKIFTTFCKNLKRYNSWTDAYF